MGNYVEPSTRTFGPQPAICGLVTGILAVIFVNWKAFSATPELEQVRCILIFFVVLLVFMNLVLISAGSNSSWAVNLGGTMFGLFWGMAAFPRIPSPGGEKMRLFGGMMTTSFFILFGLLLFTTDAS